ncbi:hypothetical protein SNEBB_003825, partial [Seison nebaliae]
TSVPLSSPGKQDKLDEENLSNLSNSRLVRNSSNGFDLILSKLDEMNSLLRQLIKNNQNPIIDPEDQKFFNELLGIDFFGDIRILGRLLFSDLELLSGYMATSHKQRKSQYHHLEKDKINN